MKQYSDDSGSKETGGEFPVIKATSPYPDDLKKPIFALNNGDFSEPIRQPTGFYIVRTEEKSVQPLNDVREPIVQEIRETHVKDWLADMNTRFTPVIKNPQFFSQPQLYLQPSPATPPPPKQ